MGNQQHKTYLNKVRKNKMKGFVFNDYGRHPSTLQAIGSGNSGHPVKDEDIVYSAWKHAAVCKRTEKHVAVLLECKERKCTGRRD